MKKHLDIEYMKAAVREALRVRSGIRAGIKGGNGKDHGQGNDRPVMRYAIVPAK